MSHLSKTLTNKSCLTHHQCTAEKYGLPELQRLALRKQGLQSGIQCSTILASARYAYAHTPDSDSKLRAHYLALIIRSRHTFKRSGTMQMEMEAGGRLFFDLFVAMSNYMVRTSHASLSSILEGANEANELCSTYRMIPLADHRARWTHVAVLRLALPSSQANAQDEAKRLSRQWLRHTWSALHRSQHLSHLTLPQSSQLPSFHSCRYFHSYTIPLHSGVRGCRDTASRVLGAGHLYHYQHLC